MVRILLSTRLGERRLTHFFALTREEWDGLRCASSGGDN